MVIQSYCGSIWSRTPKPRYEDYFPIDAFDFSIQFPHRCFVKLISPFEFKFPFDFPLMQGSWIPVRTTASRMTLWHRGSKLFKAGAVLQRMLFSSLFWKLERIGQSFLVIIRVQGRHLHVNHEEKKANLSALPKSLMAIITLIPMITLIPATPPRLSTKATRSRTDRSIGRRRYGPNLRQPWEVHLPGKDGIPFLGNHWNTPKTKSCRSTTQHDVLHVQEPSRYAYHTYVYIEYLYIWHV